MKLLHLTFLGASLGFQQAPRGGVRLRPLWVAAKGPSERVEFELRGNVRTAFFANVVRKELVFNRGMKGEIKPGGADDTVIITVEGPRRKLESFVRWCSRPELALEGDNRKVMSTTYSDPQGISEFRCDDTLCALPPLEERLPEITPPEAAPRKPEDEITEADLIRDLTKELS